MKVRRVHMVFYDLSNHPSNAVNFSTSAYAKTGKPPKSSRTPLAG
jgi:hypothetical protein